MKYETGLMTKNDLDFAKQNRERVAKDFKKSISSKYYENYLDKLFHTRLSKKDK